MKKSDAAESCPGVIVVAPTGQDASLAVSVLEKAGITSHTRPDLGALACCLGPETDAVILAQEAIVLPELPLFLEALKKQPPWSDLPLIILTSSAVTDEVSTRTLAVFGSSANVTLLERPFGGVTLVSTVQAVLRARRRQREVRDLLDQREAALASISDAFVALDREWRYIYANESAARLAHLSRDEMIGRCIWTMYPEAVGGTFYTHAHRAVETQQPQHFEKFYERWNCWMETRIYPAADGVVVFRADINVRKEQELRMAEADRKLQENERLLRLAIEATSIGTFDFRPRTGELFWSDRCRELFGLPPEAEISHDTFLAGLHPDDRERTDAAVQAALRPGGSGDFEIEYRVVGLEDRRERWIAASGRAVFGEDGEADRFIGTVLDITARRRAEDALRESERLFRDMANTAPARLWITEPDGACSFLSRGWYEFTGQTEEESLGLGWTNVIHPDDRPHAAEVFLEANRKREPFQLDYRLRRADGEYRWAIDAGRPRFAPDGEFLGFIGSVIDVHERRVIEEALRQGEKQLRFVTDHAITVFLAHCDREGRYVFVNEPYAKRFRRTPEQVVGRHLREVIGEAAFGTIAPYVEAALRGERVEFEIEVPYEEGNRWMHCTYVPEMKEAAVRSFVAVIQDTTERKLSELALEKARQQAEEANRAKDQFLAMLSHELRTPLTPVLMTLASLRREPEISDAFRRDLEVMQRNIELERLLIDDLLDLTRISHGKFELHNDAVDIHAVIENALAITAAELGEKNHRLTRHFDAKEHHCWADAARLQQVCWNVLKNAFKFTPAGGVIEIRTFNDDAHRIMVEITDSGVGIAPELQPRIFDAFEQGGRRVTSQFGGLGLGLAISKRVIDMHGGEIAVRSEGAGKGATFTITLKAMETSLLAGPVYFPEERSLQPQRVAVLLVEDHQDTARVMRRILEGAGYLVQNAGTVAEARQLAAERPFDLVISDVGLPDGSGLELMRGLREAGGPPGIALSGFGTEEDVAASKAAGFSEHLTKPVDWERLRQSIEDITAPRLRTVA